MTTLSTSVNKAIKSRGAAISRQEKSKAEVIKAMFKDGNTPLDIANSVSTILVQLAEGMSQIQGYKPVELVKLTDKSIDKQIDDLAQCKANTSDKAKKAKFADKIAELRKQKAVRKEVKKLISHEPRDYAAMLISEYKRDLRSKLLTANKNNTEYTSKDAARECDELGYKMKQECADVFSIKLTQGEKQFAPDAEQSKDSKASEQTEASEQSKDSKASGLTQHAKNLLHAVQNADELPLAAKETNALVKILNKLSEVNH